MHRLVHGEGSDTLELFSLVRTSTCKYEPVVLGSNTRVEPLAVVVESYDALVTEAAVLGCAIDIGLAQVAVDRVRIHRVLPLKINLFAGC